VHTGVVGALIDSARRKPFSRGVDRCNAIWRDGASPVISGPSTSSVVVNSVFRLASPETGRRDVLNRGGRLDGGASGDDARGCVVDGVEPGGELEVVLSLPGGTITLQDTFFGSSVLKCEAWDFSLFCRSRSFC